MDSFTPFLSGTSQRFFAKMSEHEVLPCFLRIADMVWISWNPSDTFSSKDRQACWGELLEWKAQHAPSSQQKREFFLPRIVGAIAYDVGLPLHHLSSRFEEKNDVCMSFSVYEQGVLIRGSTMMIVGDDAFRNRVAEIDARPMPDYDLPSLYWTSTLSEEEHAGAIERILCDIRAGEYYQLNMTYHMHARSDVNHRLLFSVLDERFTPTRGAYFSCADGTHILSLSPETFIMITGRSLCTHPIKGTRMRGKNEAEDLRLQQELLSDEKENAELSMIVDLLRNDLGKICTSGSVRVVTHREMLAGPSVWHTASTIEGTLREDITNIDALREMFPGGSITGCPKRASMRAIDTLETSARGLYTGALVMFDDADDLQSSLLIRTIVANDDNLSLGVGGGIVIDSKPEKEWEETRRKVAPFLSSALPSASAFQASVDRLTPSPKGGGKLTWINGAIAQSDDPRMALLDPSNPHAYGVFETLLCTSAGAHDLQAHLTRLQSSAKIVDMNLPCSIDTLEENIHQMMTHYSSEQSQTLKIVCTETDCIVSLSPFERVPLPPRGISVITVKMERTHPEAKALPYHKEYEAHAKAVLQGCAEAILINTRNEVTEGAYSNVFWMKDGVLFTRENDVLQGITRAKVMENAKKESIPFQFAIITKEELLTMDEVFITSSLRGIVPVAEIDGVRVGRGRKDDTKQTPVLI